MKKPNPIIVKAKKEAYEMGYMNGVEIGKSLAVNQLADKFDNLQEVEGIGEKTLERIIKHFGEQYFEKVES